MFYLKNKFSGKRLLILGSNAGSINIIKYAKLHGCHTIVTDYLSKEKSPAKMLSDEALLISTADIDKLVKIVKEKHIDAVLAGVSEFNLVNAMIISEKAGLRFYCSKSQWDNIAYKDSFRQLCLNYGVPCPKTYFIGSKITQYIYNTIKYPVIIKPVDGSSSSGVHICFDEKELKIVLSDTLSASKKGKIIIEEYIHGNEFTAHYSINNGKVTLSCIDNRYSVSIHQGNVTTIPIARVYPSLYTNQYIKTVNSAVIGLCKGLKLDYGILFVQGIYNPTTGKFWIFEGGLRSAAELPSRFINVINETDAIHMLTDYALLGESNFDSEKEDPFLQGKCCGIVSFVSKGGKIREIRGLEEAIALTPSVVEYENRYPVGSEIPNSDTLKQLMIRFVMICESREQLASDVDYLNEHIQVFDENGSSMIIKIEPSRLLNEF